MVKTFVINMNKSTERLARMKNRLDGIEFERLCADTVPKYPVIQDIPKSVAGCAQSHVHSWNLVYSRGYDKALILEDDALINKEIMDKVDEIDIPDDCDIYMIGYSGLCDVNRKYEPYTVFIRPFLKLRRFEKYDTCFVPESFAGFHSYIITRKGAEKLKDIQIDHHIDYQISCMLDVRVYAHNENLVCQDFIDSNNINVSNINLLDTFLSCIRDKYNTPLSYTLNVTFYKHFCTYHIIFFIGGLLRLPMFLVTLNPMFLLCFFLGFLL